MIFSPMILGVTTPEVNSENHPRIPTKITPWVLNKFIQKFYQSISSADLS